MNTDGQPSKTCQADPCLSVPIRGLTRQRRPQSRWDIRDLAKENRRLALLDELNRWAGEANVALVGTEDTVTELEGVFREDDFEEIARVELLFC